MSGLIDLTRFLKDWPYDEERNVRFLTTADGREIMQIRLPLGVEQYEMDGRPDGKRPFGRETFLDEMRERVSKALLDDQEYTISPQDYAAMRQEGILYYFRYLVLFQAGRYENVIRDTSHNLELSEMVDRYYQGEDRSELLQYRPYIIRINGISRALRELAGHDKEAARTELERSKEEILALEDVETPIFEIEKLRSLQHIDQVLEQVGEAEMSPQERLEEDLRKALQAEDYERAARIRDRLRGGPTPGSAEPDPGSS